MGLLPQDYLVGPLKERKGKRGGGGDAVIKLEPCQDPNEEMHGLIASPEGPGRGGSWSDPETAMTVGRDLNQKPLPLVVCTSDKKVSKGRETDGVTLGGQGNMAWHGIVS